MQRELQERCINDYLQLRFVPERCISCMQVLFSR